MAKTTKATTSKKMAGGRQSRELTVLKAIAEDVYAIRQVLTADKQPHIELRPQQKPQNMPEAVTAPMDMFATCPCCNGSGGILLDDALTLDGKTAVDVYCTTCSAAWRIWLHMTHWELLDPKN